MASIAIAAIAFSGLAVGLGSGFYTARDARNHLYAINAVRQELETIRISNYDAVVSGTFYAPNDQLDMIPNATGTRTVSNGSGADIKVVTLTASWASDTGRALSHSITTNFTRKGLNGES